MTIYRIPSLLCIVCSTALCALDFQGVSEQPVSDQPVSQIKLAWKEPPVGDYGISTTLEDGRGNWYIKKQHTKAALEITQKIQERVGAILAQRDLLEEIQALIEGQVAEFFAAAGFAPSELDERLSSIVQQIEKNGAQKSLSERDREVIAEAEARKKEVAALKGDLELLNRLQAMVSEAVRIAQREIAQAERYTQRAAQLYDEIDMTISDERADKLLASLRADESNLIAIERYIGEELPRYSEQMSASIRQTIGSLQKKIADLKEKGLSLEKRVQQEKQKQKPTPPAIVEPEAWYKIIFDMIRSFFSKIAAFLGIKI